MGNKPSAPPPIRIAPIHIPAPPPIRIAPIHIAPIQMPKPALIRLPAMKPISLPPMPRLPPPPPPIHIDIPKPKIDMAALQKFTGALAGAVAVTPMGKVMMMGITTVADAATHGAASNYLNSGMQVNSTLGMLPGGVLAQRLANDASNGKSGDALAKFVPDPVHLVIHDAKAVAVALVTNPASTLSVVKAAAQDNRAALLTVGSNDIRASVPVSSIVVPAALSRNVSVVARPSLLTLVAAATMPASTITTTAKSVAKPALFVMAAVEVAVPPVIHTTLSSALSPLKAGEAPVAALASTLSLDVKAAVVKLPGVTTLSIVPLAASTLSSIISEAKVIVAPVVHLENTLTHNISAEVAKLAPAPAAAAAAPPAPLAPPPTTISSSPPAAATVIVPPPTLATTLSQLPVGGAPALDLGYLPAAGLLGVVGLMLL